VRLEFFSDRAPIPFDVYLSDKPAPRLILRKGELASRERLDRLKGLAQSGREFLAPDPVKEAYKNSLLFAKADLENNIRIKARFIHNSMLSQVRELFTRNDTFFLVQGAKALVEELVRLVNEDQAAVKSILRLSLHDHYTYRHSVNVAVYSIAIARQLNGSNPEFLVKAGMGGLLHDIGKRKIHEHVINKVGKLSEEEWVEVKRHPVYGENFVQSLTMIPKDVCAVVRQHHENFDGTGYPNGLKGNEIQDLTRIVTVADVFDALTTNRSYQQARTPAEAFGVMYSLQPGKFDTNILTHFYRFLYRKKRLRFEGDNFDPCEP
jgi:putative nucleotidyltransferase with HDIG domain